MRHQPILLLFIYLIGCDAAPQSRMAVAKPSPGSIVLEVADTSFDPVLTQVTGMVSLEGTLLVSDANYIHAIAPAGAIAQRVGGHGGGPGLYRRIAWMQKAGSDLYIYDARERRVTILGDSLEVRSTLDARRVIEGGLARPLCMAEDSSFLGLSPASTRQSFPEGLYTTKSAPSMWGGALVHLDTIADPPRWAWVDEAGHQRNTFLLEVPFHASELVACTGGTLHWLTDDQSSVRRVDGAQVTNHALPKIQRAFVTAALRSSYADSVAEVMPAGLHHAYAAAMTAAPDSLTLYRRLVVAEQTGDLWLLNAATSAGRPVWSIHSSTGTFIRAVDFDPGFDLRGANQGNAWGVRTYDDGSMSVVKYRF